MPPTQILTKDEFCVNKEQWISRIKRGEVFIYPTDTIYGIGTNAMIEKGVQRIRELKSRFTRPFSILAPSKEWIIENCQVPEHAHECLDKLPGPYTLIFKLKDDAIISDKVLNGSPTVGVRIPDHWFSDVVAELGYPVTTTSANLVGENFMTSLEDLNDQVKQAMDFIIYEGEKIGRPSTIVDCTKEDLEETTR